MNKKIKLVLKDKPHNTHHPVLPNTKLYHMLNFKLVATSHEFKWNNLCIDYTNTSDDIINVSDITDITDILGPVICDQKDSWYNLDDINDYIEKFNAGKYDYISSYPFGWTEY